jgi:hypothetical protein
MSSTGLGLQLQLATSSFEHQFSVAGGSQWLNALLADKFSEVVKKPDVSQGGDMNLDGIEEFEFEQCYIRFGFIGY